MRRAMQWVTTWMVVGLFVAISCAVAGEEKVDLANVPGPVLDAVKARFPGAGMKGAGKEMEEGKLVYEVAIKDKGQSIDVTLTPEGSILMVEKTIAQKDLPEPVAKGLGGKYPGAKYKIVEEINEVQQSVETLAYYEVLLVTSDKRTLEVEVSTDGKIVKETAKGSGDDEGEEEEED